MIYNNWPYILIGAFFGYFVAEKIIILRFMNTMRKWQESQDKMILKLIDGRKSDLEREIAHLKVSGGINEAQAKLINIVDKKISMPISHKSSCQNKQCDGNCLES